MNNLGGFSQNFRWLCACLRNSFPSKYDNLRYYCVPPRVFTSTEKSINHVTLLGRVGINPQLRGSETRPVAVFTLATNIKYKQESGEYQQKTEWHRISVFRQHLQEIVLNRLKKGTRLYVEGRISYGEVTDANGVVHNTTTIIANEIIFLSSKRDEINDEEAEEDVL